MVILALSEITGVHERFVSLLWHSVTSRRVGGNGTPDRVKKKCYAETCGFPHERSGKRFSHTQLGVLVNNNNNNNNDRLFNLFAA